MSQPCVVIGTTINKSSNYEFVTKLTQEYMARGFRVVQISDGCKTELVNETSNPVILTWPSRRPTGLKDAWFLLHTLRHYQPAITIANFGSVNLMLSISFICRVPARLAWVRTLSSQVHASWYQRIRKKFFYSFATGLIANSSATKSDLQKNYGIDGDKVTVVPNSVNIPNAKKLTEVPSNSEIVYVGRLHATKGVDTLLKAFVSLVSEYPALRLTIIGDGEERPNLEGQCKDLQISPDQCVFLGVMSKSEVLQAFQRAFFVVVPSLREAFGYVVIEAMSMGAAVIGSNIDGIGEIIDDGENGLLFQVADSDDLYAKMKYLVDNAHVLEKVREGAYQHAAENYNIKKTAAEFVSFTVET